MNFNKIRDMSNMTKKEKRKYIDKIIKKTSVKEWETMIEYIKKHKLKKFT